MKLPPAEFSLKTGSMGKLLACPKVKCPLINTSSSYPFNLYKKQSVKTTGSVFTFYMDLSNNIYFN